MKWTVLWKQAVELEPARLWTDSDDRQAVSLAADRIDAALRSDPNSQGESRSGGGRVAFEPPLVVQFEVNEGDRIVNVLAIHLIEDREED
jgi:hypothetical protein